MSTNALNQKFFVSFFQKRKSFFLSNIRHAWLPLCLIGGLLSACLGQDATWDLQNYHLYNAFALFHPHRHDVIIAQIQSFLNPLLDIPLYLLTISFTHTPQLIAFCMGLPFGFVFYFTLRVAFRLFAWRAQNAAAALIATLFGITGTATAAQIGLCSNEIPVAALVIAGFYFLLVAVATRGASRQPLLRAGLFIGLAAGAKLTALPYAAGLAAAAVAALPPRRLPAALITIGAAGLLGVLATGGAWMAHLTATYGSPIFPYDNQIFHAPWAAPWGYNDVRFFPHTRLQWIFFPFWWARRCVMVVTEIPFADPRFAAIFMAAPAAAAAALCRRRVAAMIPPPEWRAILVFWLTAYMLWEKLFSIYRYAVPLELLGGMIFVGAIRAVAPARPRLATAAAGILTAAICATSLYPDWGRVPFHGASMPVRLPPLPPRSLIVSTGAQAVSFLALRAPPGTVFVGANNNFSVGDTSLTWNAVATTIRDWRGPIEIIEAVQGDPVGRDIIAAEYGIVATGPCQLVQSVWNGDALRLCAAHRERTTLAHQPAISFGFTAGDPGTAYLRAGWSHPEDFGRWSIGNDAVIALPVNAANAHPLTLSVLAFSAATPTAPGRHVDVYANGRLVAHWALSGVPAVYQAAIPPLGGAAQLSLRLHIPDAYSPLGPQSQGDPRPLGIAMIHLSLREILASP